MTLTSMSKIIDIPNDIKIQIINMKLIYTLTLTLFLQFAYGQSAQDFADIGYSAMQKQDYNVGLTNFSKAIQADPKKAWFYHNRAVCYDALEKYQNAIADFTKALSIEKTADSYNGIGITYTNLNNFNEAIKNFKLALILDKTNVETYFNLGYAYGNLKKYPEALNSFNNAIKITPKHYSSLHGRAITLITMSRYNEALVDLNTIDNMKPNDLEIIRYRAMCYYEAKQYKNAINDYSKLIEADNKDVTLLSKRANCYKFNEEPDKAIIDFSSILTVIKNSNSNWLIAETYYWRGDLYSDAGKYELAINDFTECLKLSPDNIEATLYRAISKFNNNDSIGACIDYLKAKEKDIDKLFIYQSILKNDPNYFIDNFKFCK
jgi:tetratricopeptide (TPR) repeat protein